MAEAFWNAVSIEGKPTEPYLLLNTTHPITQLQAESLARLLLLELHKIPVTLIAADEDWSTRTPPDFTSFFTSDLAIDSTVPLPSVEVFAEEVQVEECDDKLPLSIPKIRTELGNLGKQALWSANKSHELITNLFKFIDVKRRPTSNNNENTMANTLPTHLQPTVPAFDETDIKGWLTEIQKIYHKFQVADGDIPKYMGAKWPEYAQFLHKQNLFVQRDSVRSKKTLRRREQSWSEQEAQRCQYLTSISKKRTHWRA